MSNSVFRDLMQSLAEVQQISRGEIPPARIHSPHLRHVAHNLRIERVMFRLTPEEKYQLGRKAATAGMSVSEYARKQLLGA